MQYFSDVVQDRNGNVVTNASVLIKNYPALTTATIYDSTGASIANPITTSSDGEYTFYCVPGAYTIVTSKSGITTKTRSNVVIGTPGATINVKEAPYGAVGDGTTDDTAAIQALLDTLASSTATANFRINMPAGTYKITSSLIPPNSASYFELVGDGTINTKIKWGGSAGSPMLKLKNARQVTVKDIAFDGNSSATPSCAIEVNRCAGQTGSPGATGCRFINLDLGGANANNLASGILYTCDSSYDASNDFGYFEGVRVEHVTNYGIAFQHSNSLEHCLVHCSFSNCLSAAVSNIGGANSLTTHVGGSFVAYGCVSGGCGTTFELFGAQHSISVYGWHAEDDVLAITTPYAITTTKLNFSAFDFYWVGLDGTAITIDSAAGSTADFYSPRFAAPATFNISLPTTGSRFNVWGGRISLTTLTYNNEVTFRNMYQEAGAPTYTNSGSGTLTLTRAAGSGVINTSPTITSGTTYDVNGMSSDLLYLQHGGATNFATMTGGIPGVTIITLLALNGNTTVKHGTSSTNFRLNGNVDFAMSTGNALTLKRLDAATSNTWVEVGRKA